MDPTGIHDDDPLSELNDCAHDSVSVGCPLNVFRVLSFNVKGQKILPSPLHTVRSDMIAVAPYSIEAGEMNGAHDDVNNALLIQSVFYRDVSIAPQILSLPYFLNIELKTLKDVFFGMCDF